MKYDACHNPIVDHLKLFSEIFSQCYAVCLHHHCFNYLKSCHSQWIIYFFIISKILMNNIDLTLDNTNLDILL